MRAISLDYALIRGADPSEPLFVHVPFVADGPSVSSRDMSPTGRASSLPLNKRWALGSVLHQPGWGGILRWKLGARK